jgi:L-rhamnonate dehydratase
MKVTDLKAFYPKYRHIGGSWRTHFWQIAVRVETDCGVVGWGYGGGGVGAVAVINRHFRELMIGCRVDTPEDIGGVWDLLYRASIPYPGRAGVAVMALSGVDLALWDVLGQANNKPVYELLGGLVRPTVQAYATGPQTAWYRDLGFSAAKLPCAQKNLEAVVLWADEARSHLGPEAMLMADAYMAWDAEQALAVARALQSHSFYWFEDLLIPDDHMGLAALRPQLKPVLLAGGEHDFTHYGFAALARSEALDLWQPDITWCGGLTAGIHIAALAAEHQIPVVPHRGGEVWGLHLLAAGYGEALAEYVMGCGMPKKTCCGWTNPDQWMAI